jgi:hypothetical protein
MPIFSPTFFSSVFFNTGGGSTSPQVIYRDHQWSAGTNFTTCTWAAMAVGPAASDRWVIAALNINHNTSRAISTVSIGGVSATKLYAAPSPRSDDGVSFEFWAANVPTGTTADVVATAASGQFWDGAAWTYTCAGEPLFEAGAVDQTSSGNTFSVSVNVAEGGAIIALSNGDEPAALSSWTGVTADFTDEAREIYAASADQLTAETGRTVAFGGTATPSPNATFYGLGVLSIRFGAGGGGTILNSPGVAIGGSSAHAVAAAIRSGVAVTAAGSAAAAPSAAIRVSVANSVGFGVAAALGGLLLTSSGTAIGAGIAAAPPAAIRPSQGTVVGTSVAVALAAAIRSSVGTSVGVSTAEAQLSALSYLISVAVAIGGSFAASPPASVRSAPATAVTRASVQAPPAMIRSAPGSVVGYAVARATAAIILGSQGVSIGGASVAAAAALIRSAPGVAVALSRAAAPAAMIRSGAGSASGIAIAAGLGILVSAQDYSTGRLAFATPDPRRGTILNQKKRSGTILNPTRRGTILNQAVREGTILNPNRRGRITELDQ